jgi:hypothetical protein
MRFYWDASHFKREVGDYVLDRVFGSSSPGRTVPPDFGVELNLQTIDQALADQMAGQHAYRLRSPEAGRVRTLVGEILTKVRASRPRSEASS